MNDLVVHDGSSAPVNRRRTSGVASLERHLAADRMIRETGLEIASTWWPTMPAVDRSEPTWQQLSTLELQRDAVAASLSRAAPEASIRAYVATIRAALDTAPDHRPTAAAIALLTDSKGRSAANPAVYVECATFDLVDEGFPPAVVVATCQRLRRESTFLPEISELVAACRVERSRLRTALQRGIQALEDRGSLERAALALPGKIQAMSKPERGVF